MRTLRFAGPLLLLAAGSSQAGVVLNIESKDSAGKSTPHEVYYVQDGMVRVDSLDARGNVTSSDIVRDNAIWRVDPAARTFSRIDQDSVKAMFGGQQAQMEAMLSRLPPDKRAAIEARMTKMHGGADTDFTDTGKTDQSGSYSCRVWQKTRAGKPVMDFCIVPPSSLPDGVEVAASMKKALDTVSQVISGVPQLAQAAETFTRMQKMGGFSVRDREIGSGTEHVLSSARSEKLSPDKFAIPQGFTEAPFGKGGD